MTVNLVEGPRVLGGKKLALCALKVLLVIFKKDEVGFLTCEALFHFGRFLILVPCQKILWIRFPFAM